jgi:hypothetical protein
MIDAALVQRYQPGGDIYAKLEAKYGRNGALLVAQAARSGTDRVDISDAIARAEFGERLDDSTASIFLKQIATNPLGAPLDAANNALKNAALSFLKNPWVLLTLAIALFVMLGGLDLVKRKVATA